MSEDGVLAEYLPKKGGKGGIKQRRNQGHISPRVKYDLF